MAAAAAHNPHSKRRPTHPLSSLSSLFLMALQRANKRERKRERLTAERLAPWGGVSFTLIPFIHFIFIDSIKTKMKFIRHFVHSTHNLCFQLHFFASLAARLLCGLVAVRLLPPLTPPKRAHWPRNQTNNAAPREAQQNKRKSKLKFFISFLFAAFSWAAPRRSNSTFQSTLPFSKRELNERVELAAGPR